MPPGYSVQNTAKLLVVWFTDMFAYLQLQIVRLLKDLSEMIKTKWPVRTFG